MKKPNKRKIKSLKKKCKKDSMMIRKKMKKRKTKPAKVSIMEKPRQI